jgi:hypothetical protein
MWCGRESEDENGNPYNKPTFVALDKLRMGFNPPIIPPRGDKDTIFNLIIVNG